MARGTKKTAHAGTSAFHDRIADAKHGSNYQRRKDRKSTINSEHVQTLKDPQRKCGLPPQLTVESVTETTLVESLTFKNSGYSLYSSDSPENEA